MPRKSALRGRAVVVTAGPTRERLDPIRFLTNASSGRMGYAVAGEALRRGASVVLVTGPVAIEPPAGARVRRVESAEEMRRETLRAVSRADALVAAAAVGDWRFARRAGSKIKRSRRSLTVRLVPNPDILLECSKRRRRSGRPSVLVGFALETGDWLELARGKLIRKDLDLIVANRKDSLGGKSARIALIGRDGRAAILPGGSKRRLAARIVDRLEGLLSDGR